MTEKQVRIGVLLGGFSPEREVSLRSGANVGEALERCGYEVHYIDPVTDDLCNRDMDLMFNVLHGGFGEDGGVQALLEDIGVPYTGSGVQASIIAMNKYVTKQLFHKHQIPTPEGRFLSSSSGPQKSDLEAGPLFVKPVSAGSSVDTYKVRTWPDYETKAWSIIQQYGSCLMEHAVPGPEITVGVLEEQGTPKALPILELRTENDFYDYDAKYTAGKTTFICPAALSDPITQYCQALAIKVHQSLGCRHFSRVDMIVDPEQGPKVLELNAVPGFTNTSDLPAQAKAAGLSFDDLIQKIVQNAQQKRPLQQQTYPMKESR